MRILFIYFVLLCAFSCQKDKPTDEFVSFTLDATFQFLPAKDTINVGDTFYFSADFADTMLELNSMKYYPVRSFLFNTVLEVMKIGNKNLSISNQLPGMSGFHFFKISGDFTPPTSRFSNIQFDYSQPNRYKSKIGVIAQSRGVYSFYFFYSPPPDNNLSKLPYIDLGASASGGKKIAVVDFIRYAINDSTTNHFKIFKDNCQLTIDPYTSPWHNRFIYYTVVVK
jgi:hypothetical protein